MGSADWLNILDLQNRGAYVDPGVSNVCGEDLFPDAGLRDAVKAELSITDDYDLCIDDMGSLTYLVHQDSSISNLTGLEYATNLKYLNLSYNQISDISALSGLTNLTYL